MQELENDLARWERGNGGFVDGGRGLRRWLDDLREMVEEAEERRDEDDAERRRGSQSQTLSPGL